MSTTQKPVTTGYIAKRLGVSDATVRRYATRDGAPHQRHGGVALFDEDAFRQWARKRYHVLHRCSEAGREYLAITATVNP